MWQMVFANIFVEGWIIHPNVYSFFDQPDIIVLLSPHYGEVINSGVISRYIIVLSVFWNRYIFCMMVLWKRYGLWQWSWERDMYFSDVIVKCTFLWQWTWETGTFSLLWSCETGTYFLVMTLLMVLWDMYIFFMMVLWKATHLWSGIFSVYDGLVKEVHFFGWAFEICTFSLWWFSKTWKFCDDGFWWQSLLMVLWKRYVFLLMVWWNMYCSFFGNGLLCETGTFLWSCETPTFLCDGLGNRYIFCMMVLWNRYIFMVSGLVKQICIFDGYVKHITAYGNETGTFCLECLLKQVYFLYDGLVKQVWFMAFLGKRYVFFWCYVKCTLLMVFWETGTFSLLWSCETGIFLWWLLIFWDMYIFFMMYCFFYWWSSETG